MKAKSHMIAQVGTKKHLIVLNIPFDKSNKLDMDGA